MKSLLKASFVLLSTLSMSSLFLSPILAEENYHIKPLQVVGDINSVDLLSGKYHPRLPVLGIPAAPNLTLETLQKFDSKIIGTEYGTSEYVVITGRKETYSLTYGSATSEFFNCEPDCEPTDNTGSILLGSIANDQLSYIQGKTGIKVVYSERSSLIPFNSPTSTKKKVGTWYASSIHFPDGEHLSIAYDTVTVDQVTYHRPNTVTSNLGYKMLFTYQSNSISGPWGGIASAKIVKTLNPTEVLAKQIYTSSTTSNLQDIQGRTWAYTGFSSYLGAADTAKNFTLKLPDDGANSIAVTSATQNYSGKTHNNFVTSVTRNGQAFNYAYTTGTGDSSKQFSKVVITGPESYSRTIDLDVFGAPNFRQLINADTDSLGNKTEYTYTGKNLIDTVTYPEGNKVKYTYDILGNVIEKRLIAKVGSGQTDIVVSAYYDVYGCSFIGCYRPDYTIDANGNRTDYTFHQTNGVMLTKHEPAGASGIRRVTTNTYTSINGFNRLTEMSVCGQGECGTKHEQITVYTYWGNTNLPKTVTKTNGNGSLSQTVTYEYDEFELGLVTIEDGPLAGTDDAIYYRYDSIGRKTWSIGAKNQQSFRVATKTTYRNQDNQVLSIEQGTLTSATDTNLVVNLTTDNFYNTKGLQIKAETFSPTTLERVSEMSYDTRNRNECSVTRMNPLKFDSLPASACTLGEEGEFGPDRVVQNTYDTNSRVIKTISGFGTSASGIDIEIGYTDNGQVLWRRDGNTNQTNYLYDGVDRLTRTTFPDGTYEQNSYDFNGNLKTWRKRDGKTLTHYYDGINLRTSTTVPSESGIYFDYDGLGRQTSVSRGSSTVGTSFDGLGRLETTTTNGRTLTYAYNNVGLRSKLTHSDGFYVNYYYDPTGALNSIVEKGTKTLVSYGYNSKGFLTAIMRNNGITSTLSHSDLGQLENFDHLTINNASFDRNPASQIISRVVSNPSFTIEIPLVGRQDYVTNSLNQYTSVDGNNIGYDLNGNLTSYDGWTYNFNAHNRLTSATKTGTALVLDYDSLGRLNSSTLDGTKTTFLYDGSELVAEYNNSGSLTNRYVHGIAEDDPLVWYIGSGLTNTRYLLANERGSIIAETNSSGSVSDTHKYGPFGEPEDTSTARFRYTGQILLPGTELYHYKARVYNPELGRFLQTDPIGYKDGINWYSYVGNDPVNNIDSTGNAAGDLFQTKEKAAEDFGKTYNDDSIRNKTEYGAAIYSSVGSDKKTSYSYNTPTTGDAGEVDINLTVPDNTTLETTVHTHGDYESAIGDPNVPSSRDAEGMIARKEFLVTPNGKLQSFDKNLMTNTISTIMPSDPNDPSRVNNISPTKNMKNDPVRN